MSSRTSPVKYRGKKSSNTNLAKDRGTNSSNPNLGYLARFVLLVFTRGIWRGWCCSLLF
jgi:hypothetical protein